MADKNEIFQDEETRLTVTRKLIEIDIKINRLLETLKNIQEELVRNQRWNSSKNKE